MTIFRPGTHPLWGAFVGLYILTAMGLDLYWLFAESGPVHWLAMLQAELLGNRWYPKLTFMVLLLAEIVPVLLLKFLIERITGTRLDGRPETPASDPRPQQ